MFTVKQEEIIEKGIKGNTGTPLTELLNDKFLQSQVKGISLE